MKKKTFWSPFTAIGLTLGMIFFLWTPGVSGDKDMKFQGEIVGLACLLSHGAMGKGGGHKKCAIKCVENGQPIGLLTDEGKVYILYAGMKDFKPFETAKAHTGTRVEVTGVVGKLENLEGLTVNAVRPL